MKILFVCTGNTCRSPMAEAIFNKISSDNRKAHTSSSAGTNVFIPQRISPKSIEALRKFGITDFAHTSHMIEDVDIENADLVLTMTSSHKFAVKNAFSKHKGKVFTLKEKAYGFDSDIADPYGMGQEEYDACAQEIKEAVEKLICIL